MISFKSEIYEKTIWPSSNLETHSGWLAGLTRHNAQKWLYNDIKSDEWRQVCSLVVTSSLLYLKKKLLVHFPKMNVQLAKFPAAGQWQK